MYSSNSESKAENIKTCRLILEKLIITEMDKRKMYELAKDEMYASGIWNDDPNNFNPVIFGVNVIIDISDNFSSGSVSLYFDDAIVTLKF